MLPNALKPSLESATRIFGVIVTRIPFLVILVLFRLFRFLGWGRRSYTIGLGLESGRCRRLNDCLVDDSGVVIETTSEGQVEGNLLGLCC